MTCSCSRNLATFNVSSEVFAARTFACKLPWLYLLSPCAVYCISHGSYRQTLYLRRGGLQDQDARVRHAHWVCRSLSQKYRYTKNRPIGVTVVFANVIYTPSARDARVRLGLVALPFPSRASGDKIRGRYSIRREVPSHLFKARAKTSLVR